VRRRAATLGQEARTDLRPIGRRSQPEAAKPFEVSVRNVGNAQKVQDSKEPELPRAVDQGRCPVTLALLPDRDRPRRAAAGPWAGFADRAATPHGARSRTAL
jgi:hypothetical protein